MDMNDSMDLTKIILTILRLKFSRICKLHRNVNAKIMVITHNNVIVYLLQICLWH